MSSVVDVFWRIWLRFPTNRKEGKGLPILSVEVSTFQVGRAIKVYLGKYICFYCVIEVISRIIMHTHDQI